MEGATDHKVGTLNMAEQRPRKRRTFRKLNPQRRKLLEEIAKGKSIGEAGRAAGYAQPQNANNAIRQMRGEVIAALEKRGWGIDEFVEKGLVPLLQAKKTIFAQHEGIFTDERKVDDNSTRLGANDQYLKILGLYAPVSVEHSGAIVDMLTEAEKREAQEAVKRLLEYDEVIDIEAEDAGEDFRGSDA